MASQVCKFWLAGHCVYGDRCRYEHKRPDFLKARAGGSGAAGGGGPGRGAAAASSGPAGANTRARNHDVSTHSVDEGEAFYYSTSAGNGAGPSATVHSNGDGEHDYGADYYAADEEYDPEDFDEAYEQYGNGTTTRYDVYIPGQDGDARAATGAGPASAPHRPPAAAEAEPAEPAVTSAAEAGLVVIDDDLGLLAEAEQVARRGRPAPAGGAAEAPGGGGGGGGSAWAAASHPWEGDVFAVRQPVDPAEVELCPTFALQGSCPEEEDCPRIHGLECEFCHKHRIHPYNVEEAAEHRATCRLRHERLEARLRSADVECGICLEPVMSKASVADRRFGLLACDHPFCLACIRAWRDKNTDATLATDTAIRTCPMCRTPTHFVTPSLMWPATPEDKVAVIDAYKNKLKTIDCKWFDKGEGTCPFSTSCFYRHAYPDGRLEEIVLRRAGNADGEVRVVAPLRLSAFLESGAAQRLLAQRRR
ncbi:hypothetical protein HYH03_001853 [Edaphochlamys debaryana]|uniref:RING-type E3 ubiquitin transferase n=1 Tax=Edaphochlamys debaryana TaxID=47281 RepID=A0A836C4W5_9CHLO|nr:hypothetical protein HYH03_001853 [Edaphochlamys debaryana]|eukprot:KAG2500275.1 hypothetical protein HYH03_001853 [Edaphochlamys debaryana]